LLDPIPQDADFDASTAHLPRLTNIPSPEKFREALGKTLAEIAATK